jgi:hypothetical protein
MGLLAITPTPQLRGMLRNGTPGLVSIHLPCSVQSQLSPALSLLLVLSLPLHLRHSYSLGLPDSATYNTNGPCQARSGSTPTWFASAASGHVCSWPSTPSHPGLVELHQDGSQLPCGNEFDTFLGPNTDVYSTYPAGMTVSQPLGQLRSLQVQFNVTMAGVPVVTDRCGTSPQCDGGGHVDYGYVMQLRLMVLVTNTADLRVAW